MTYSSISLRGVSFKKREYFFVKKNSKVFVRRREQSSGPNV